MQKSLLLAAITTCSLSIALPLSTAVRADDLAVGTWNGSIRVLPRQPGGAVRNNPVSLEIKKVADPLTRWRGTTEILSVLFIRGNNRAEASIIELSDTKLVFSFQQGENPEDASRCELMKRPTGSFEGTCSRLDNRIVILSPPDPEKAPAAAASTTAPPKF